MFSAMYLFIFLCLSLEVYIYLYIFLLLFPATVFVLMTLLRGYNSVCDLLRMFMGRL